MVLTKILLSDEGCLSSDASHAKRLGHGLGIFLCELLLSDQDDIPVMYNDLLLP